MAYPLKLLAAILIAGFALTLSGCIIDPDQQTVTAAQVYCQTMGYRFEERLDVNGEPISVCVFLDNFECDALAFFAGQCFPERTYCALSGFTVETRVNEDGERPYALCRFTDGSACMEFDFALLGDKCVRVRDVNTCVELPGGICRTLPTPPPR
jgi:putative hemolysin